MIYLCCEENRRAALKGHKHLNGIDYLEIQHHPGASRHRPTVLVRCINPLRGEELTAQNIQITGGDAIRDVAAIALRAEQQHGHPVVHVTLNKQGDASRYVLRLVRGPRDESPPHGFDPALSSVEFSFLESSFSGVDCLAAPACPPESGLAEPKIDYLAKDYNSFRQLMLDRLSQIMPGWSERHPADMGIALVELLAYVGDHLSYQQDVIATEAYLDTARMRLSARRHARLVDYFMHDGCNARAWVQVSVRGENVLLKEGTPLLTQQDGLPPRIPSSSSLWTEGPPRGAAVFETMHDISLFRAHDEMHFYTWGDAQCCLPRGATSATLCDDPSVRLSLRVGDVLIFEERTGPDSGDEADADPAHRHAVRLTSVNPEATVSPTGTRAPGSLRTDPLTGQGIVEIGWFADDALPFPLCISSTSDPDHGNRSLANVSVAHGNIVLADHGMTVSESLPPILPQHVAWVRPSGDRCAEPQATLSDVRYRPRLKQGPLTQVPRVTVRSTIRGHTAMEQRPFDPSAPAVSVSIWQMRDVLPAISLSDGKGLDWCPQRDLLASDSSARELVAEVDDDGGTTLRFGDGRYGARPAPGIDLVATYRVGNGSAGNIGSEMLAHIVTDNDAVTGIRNPLSATGGVDPESLEEVRQRAPVAFLSQERAVTEADYEDVVQQLPQVLQCRARFVWTGSWRTVFLAVEPRGGALVDREFKRLVARHVERFRMAGYDLQIDGPVYVPLEIDATVWVRSEYFRSDVRAAVHAVLTSGLMPDGGPGVFYPDNFTFGQSVYLSPLYAAAQSVTGVDYVEVTRFQRLDAPAAGPVPGRIAIGPQEVARLDTEANVPERGILRLTLQGGK